MKPHPFQVGDKVTLRPLVGRLAVSPQPATGRLYCVTKVSTRQNGCHPDTAHCVELAGIRRDRRARYITDDLLPAGYFRLVHQAGGHPERKEAKP